MATATPEAKVPWSTGLFDCFSNVPNCCMTLWCPCVTFGRIAEIVERGSSPCCCYGVLYILVASITGCQCLLSSSNRSKMRKQYRLEGNTCVDCLTHSFCETCALCQEYRELENRGFDINWDGMEVLRQQLMLRRWKEAWNARLQVLICLLSSSQSFKSLSCLRLEIKHYVYSAC